MSIGSVVRAVACGAFAATLAACAKAPTSVRAPEREAGFVNNTWSALDAELERSVAAGEVRGVVVVVARNGLVAYEGAVGRSGVDDAPMTVDTVFDVASIAKPVATAAAVAVLMCDGTMADGDPLDTATIGEALVHQTDLPQYAAWEDLQPFLGANGTPAQAVEGWLREREPKRWRHPYSNLGYILLAGAVEERAGTSMEAFLRERLWGPLGMDRTTFTPSTLAGARFAATAADVAPGTPFDPLADWVAKRSPGHMAGHSGLFSTAGDLTVFCQTLLNAGDSSVPQMKCVADTLFGDAATRLDEGDPAGTAQFSKSARSRGFNRIDSTVDGPIYWHTGYTGALVWMNAKTGTSVVLLTNTTLTTPTGWDALRGKVLKIVNKGTTRPQGEELYDPGIYTPGDDDLGVIRISM